MKRRREDDTNLVHRIALRQCCAAPPAAAAARSRRLYESVAPSTCFSGIEPPPGLCFCRFTPCGRFLVSFDVIRNEAVLHRFKGLHCSQPDRPAVAPSDGQSASTTATGAAANLNAQHEASSPPLAGGAGSSSGAAPAWRPGGPRFEDAFDPHARCALTAGPEEQLMSLCLVAHGEYLILASLSPETRPLDAEEGWFGVSDSTTFYLVRLADGSLADRIVVHADCHGLANNEDVSLCGDILLALAPAVQVLLLLRVLPSGKFQFLQALGPHCQEDDGLVIGLQDEAERRWRQQHPAHPLAASAALAGELFSAAAAITADPGAVALQQPQQPQQHAGHPSPAMLAPPGGPLIDGLKQRMLAFLFLRALEETEAAAAAGVGADGEFDAGASGQAGVGVGGPVGPDGLPTGPRALNSFHYFFQSYADLLMAKAQLLDRERVLVFWLPGPTAASAAPRRPGSHRGVRMVFNTRTRHVESLSMANSQHYTAWSLATPAAALNGAPCSEWERFLAPGAFGQEHSQRDSSSADALVSSGCQCRQPSPYLDPELFQYDERFVSPDAQPRPLLHRAAKFVARARPERLHFRFDPEQLRPPPARRRGARAGGNAAAVGGIVGGGDAANEVMEEAEDEDGGAPAREVVFLFHPIQPFVLAAIEEAETGVAESLTFYTRL